MTSANGTNALAGNSCKQACWVPLHERDPVLDRTQRSRAAQRAPRASCNREAHAVPIYPSGMPPNCLCYYTLITTESTLWPITDLVITKNNDVLMM